LDRTVFAPWVNKGSGYILPDKKYENDIRKALVSFYSILALLYILLLAVFGPLFLLLLLPLYYIVKIIIAKLKTKGLQSVKVNFTVPKY